MSSNDLTAFSPDGRLLAVAGPDEAVHLWHLATGKELAKFEGHRGGVLALAFSPDGKTLASGSADTSILIWDVAGLLARTQPKPAELSAAEVKARWGDLASTDAAKAFGAICALADSPRQAMPFLAEHLKPARPFDARRAEQLIADLDSEDFQTRRRASTELQDMGKRSAPALRKALEGKPSPETRKRLEELLKLAEAKALSAEPLRAVRAVEALERMGSPEARQLLEQLAKGAPEAEGTAAARATLERLKK